MIGIVGVGMQARADRWMYVPLIGLAWIGRLAELAGELDRRSVSWFGELGVELNVFGSTDELARWLGVESLELDGSKRGSRG